MRDLRKVSLFVVLTLVGLLGLSACGDSNPPAATAVPTAAATTAPTEAVEPTAAEVATTAPTTEPTAMEVATTEPTTVVSEATPTTGGGGGGGMTITGPAADLLNQYYQKMKDLKSYHYTTLTEVSGITSKSEGDFEAPNKSRVSTDLGSLGTSESIVIGTDTYSKSPGQDAYVHTVVPNIPQGMDLAPYILSAEIVGDEPMNGASTTHVKFTYDADKMMQDLMTQMGQTGTQLPSMGKSDSEVWVDKSTGLPVQQVSKVKVDVAGTSMETTSTQIFSKFNETVTPPIEKPANVTESPAIPSIEVPTFEIPTIEIPTITAP